MADMKQWRCKHRELICAMRVVEDRFGPQAVDDVAARHMGNIREAFRRKAEETGRNDLATLAETVHGPSETHEHQLIRQDERVLEVKVTRCDHAAMFAEWNARDIGLKFMCAGDDAMIAGLNPKIRLERPSLIMKGGPCCHFIYTLDD